MTIVSRSHWTHRITYWPGAIAGFTARGEHDPADPESGFNLGHTHHADHEAVDRRRAEALVELGIPEHRIVLADQVHGTHVAVARAADLPHLEHRYAYPYYPQTDALITDQPGLALLLFFADCCPVWVYAETPRCGGVAHCGWRGSVADMTGAIVTALHEQFGAPPASLQAVVGPAIGGECYEVGPEVVEAVAQCEARETIRYRDGSSYLDLPQLNALLLARHGIPPERIRVIDSCTRCGPVPLYSWRRDGTATGRMAGLFALR